MCLKLAVKTLERRHTLHCFGSELSKGVSTHDSKTFWSITLKNRSCSDFSLIKLFNIKTGWIAKSFLRELLIFPSAFSFQFTLLEERVLIHGTLQKDNDDNELGSFNR